jgi:hypothetical protein
MKKTGVILLSLSAYMVLLIAINVLHFRFLPVDVVLYAALADALVAALISGMVLVVMRRATSPGSLIGDTLRTLTGTESALIATCALLIGYIFAITVPTIIDRSLSVYILEKLDQRGGAIALDAMNEIFIKEFIPEYRLMDVRMTEQLSSGTLIIENGCVKLTHQGKRIAGLTRFYRTMILPKKRVLMGEISNDLVDPFRRSEEIVDYRCESGR